MGEFVKSFNEIDLEELFYIFVCAGIGIFFVFQTDNTYFVFMYVLLSVCGMLVIKTIFAKHKLKVKE